MEVVNLGADTEHGKEREKVEKGHWLTTNTIDDSARSEEVGDVSTATKSAVQKKQKQGQKALAAHSRWLPH